MGRFSESINNNSHEIIFYFYFLVEVERCNSIRTPWRWNPIFMFLKASIRPLDVDA